MINAVNSRLARLFSSASISIGILLFAVSAAVLSGWAAGIPSLKSVLPNLVPMTPNTAVCFILLSVSLLCFSGRRRWMRTVSVACAWTVAVVGAATIAEYATGINTGLDTVFFGSASRAYATPFPGRMSPLSALNFVMASVSLAVFGMRVRLLFNISELFLAASGAIGLLTIIGYMFATPDLYSFHPFKPMAVHTGLCFMLVCAGGFFARLDCDVMKVMSSDTEGGIMVRRMLFLGIFIPVLLGWVILSGARSGLYNLSLGVSFLTVLTIVVFSVLIWENGRSLHLIDLKRMGVESILRENEDKYRVIFETTGTATAIYEEDTVISLANTEFEKLSGYQKAELESKKSYMDFIATEEDAARIREYHRLRRLDPGLAPRTYEFKFKGRSGQVRDIFMTIAMIPGTMRSIASLQDITERKRVEQMKSDFVSMVSHQLKTPVAQVKGYIYNMLAGLTGELTAKQREYLEDMQDISNKNYRMLSDLLNVSRIERGVISMDIRPVALKDIIDEAAAPFYEQIKAKGLQLAVAGLENELIVLADKEKSIEAIGNAVHNALKFTESGSISLRVSSTASQAIVAVIDTGRGIAQDRLNRMFTCDMALDGAPVSGGGAGLGLYIAKQFMRLQNGDIAVQSIPGKGSSFIFTIPLAQG
ncbi:MAG TPA: PAS domain-containing sensor histidine kinase [Candidatus Omnitrophota bacterium]|nr:PAS domain-containing sensor histidine kinase [Candidatus Omnitrophota bacterium]